MRCSSSASHVVFDHSDATNTLIRELSETAKLAISRSIDLTAQTCSYSLRSEIQMSAMGQKAVELTPPFTYTSAPAARNAHLVHCDLLALFGIFMHVAAACGSYPA